MVKTKSGPFHEYYQCTISPLKWQKRTISNGAFCFSAFEVREENTTVRRGIYAAINKCVSAAHQINKHNSIPISSFSYEKKNDYRMQPTRSTLSCHIAGSIPAPPPATDSAPPKATRNARPRRSVRYSNRCYAGGGGGRHYRQGLIPPRPQQRLQQRPYRSLAQRAGRESQRPSHVSAGGRRDPQAGGGRGAARSARGWRRRRRQKRWCTGHGGGGGGVTSRARSQRTGFCLHCLLVFVSCFCCVFVARGQIVF